MHLAQKFKYYVKLPYIHDRKFLPSLKRILNHHFPAVDVRFTCVNPRSIGGILKHKEKLPSLMQSGVVYLFNCCRCNQQTYIGSTRRLLKVRCDAHKGVSYRTGSKLTNPEQSNIRNHARICKTDINYNNFKIIMTSPYEQHLLILESLAIKKLVPSLNNHTTSVPLYIA